MLRLEGERFRNGAVTLTLIAVPLIGLGAGALAATYLTQSANVDQHVPTWIPVETAPLMTEARLTLDLEWADAATVRSAGWSGLVTAVLVRPGDAVVTGTPIVEVNGVRRIAYSAERPLFEPVGRESSGASRATLTSLLASLGYISPDTAWGSAMIRAIRAFAADIGVHAPGDLTEFDPSWVVWIPAESVEVGGDLPQVGGSAPDEVFSLPPALSRLQLSDGEATPNLSAHAWQLTINDASIPVESFPLESQDQLAVLAKAVGAGSPTTVDGVLSLLDPVYGWAVPSSSVLVGSDGSRCVVTVDKRGGDGETAFELKQVETLTGSPPGVAWLGGTLPSSGLVLTRPTEVAEAFECG